MAVEMRFCTDRRIAALMEFLYLFLAHYVKFMVEVM